MKSGQRIKKGLKIAIFVIAGLAAGMAFACLDPPGFRFAMAPVRKGVRLRPFYVRSAGGRRVLALSLKDLQDARNIEIRADGALVQSWYPPVVRMPYSHSPDFRDGTFRGARSGETLPVYIVFRAGAGGNNKNGKIEISADGAPIKSITVLGGKRHESR